MYKLLTSGSDQGDFFNSFRRDPTGREVELSNRTDNFLPINIERWFLLSFLNNFLGFIEHLSEGTDDLGFKVHLERNSDKESLNRATATLCAKCFKNFLPHHTARIIQCRLISSEHSVSRSPTKLRYIGISVYSENVSAQNDWKLKTGVKSEIDGPFLVFVGFQKGNWWLFWEHKKDVFVRLPVLWAQWFLGTENYLDVGIKFNFDGDYYSLGYGENVSGFRE